jgi:ankyrin repeat protein
MKRSKYLLPIGIGVLLSVGMLPVLAFQQMLMGSNLAQAADLGNEKTVNAMLARGVDVDYSEEEAEITPLVLASQSGHSRVVEILIKHGADLEAENRWGGRPLSVAAAGGHDEVVLQLLKAGAKINAGGTNGNTALMSAAQEGQAKTVALLLKQGADASLRDIGKKTALDYAKEHKQTETITLLASRKASKITQR